jgi:hypothetical protein
MSTDLHPRDGINAIFHHSGFFSPFSMFVFPKKWEEDSSSVYFRRLSAMYATAPMMQAATTAMTIVSSALISGCSITVGSGSSGVGCSGVGCSGVGSSGVGSLGVGCVGSVGVGCSGSIGAAAEAAGPTVTQVVADELP